MSRRRKPGRPKGSKNKKIEEASGLRPNLSSETLKSILGLFLFVFAFIIFLSLFGLAGTFGLSLYSRLRVLIGWTVFFAPLISGSIGYALFFPEKYSMGKNLLIGVLILITSLSGIFHVFLPLETSMEMARDGLGGGYIGYLVQANILKIFNAPVSFIVLLAAIIASILIATNRPLRAFWSSFKKEDEGKEAPKEDIKINAPTPVVMRRSDLKKPDKEREEFEVLPLKDDSGWVFPDASLFEAITTQPDSGDIKKNASIIQKTLGNFGIEVAMSDVNVGPTVTQYTLKPQEGIKLNKITTLDKDLALSLAAHPIRIEAPIPGKSLVGIEVPNSKSATVRMRDILESGTFKAKKTNMAVVLGLDVAGHPQVADLSKMPHLLIAGATGSGKSVCINSILSSLLYQNSPNQLRLILVDPKRVELSLYNNIPHLLAPVIVDSDKTVSALKWAVTEMEKRYHILQEAGKRNIVEFNTSGKEKMSYIVVVIDELADLMAVSASEAEGLIVRLAQMARAVGIHLILATQRPSVNVITGLIKANITTRVAFSVASQVDSRTIIDQSGAEKLLGNGDMLFVSAEVTKPLRIQGTYVSEKEVRRITDFLKQNGQPEFNAEILSQPVRAGGGGDFDAPDDDLFEEACDVVIRSGKASASLLQRRLRIGYARAARLLDLLEERGVVGPQDGARPRDVLVDDISDVIEG
ncbi:MAG: DNA translocase FtsK [Patescibacteria group bacterium]|nr:DNA translocase FtsK [Patescibacteria group bacterium]